MFVARAITYNSLPCSMFMWCSRTIWRLRVTIAHVRVSFDALQPRPFGIATKSTFSLSRDRAMGIQCTWIRWSRAYNIWNARHRHLLELLRSSAKSSKQNRPRFVFVWQFQTTLCLKKVPTFKLSVTLSNRNRFSKKLHCWKAYEICYKTHTTIPISP